MLILEIPHTVNTSVSKLCNLTCAPRCHRGTSHERGFPCGAATSHDAAAPPPPPPRPPPQRHQAILGRGCSRAMPTVGRCPGPCGGPGGGGVFLWAIHPYGAATRHDAAAHLPPPRTPPQKHQAMLGGGDQEQGVIQSAQRNAPPPRTPPRKGGGG